MSEYEPPCARGRYLSEKPYFGFENEKWYRTFAWLPVALKTDKDYDPIVWLKPVCVRYYWGAIHGPTSSEYRPYDSKVERWTWAPICVKGLVRTVMVAGAVLLAIGHCAILTQ